MVNERDRCERKIDKALDRYADDVAYAELELLLQERAQDMRERSIDAEEGWADVDELLDG